MAKTDFKSVAEYLTTLPKQTRLVLQRVRAIIRKAVPAGEEVISYQIPAVKLEGRAVIYFAGWKEHYSLYPATEKVVTSLARKLAQYEVRKGTIRFPLSEPVPVELVAEIAKIRASEATLLSEERRTKKAKKTSKKKAKTKKTSKKKIKLS